MIFGGAFKDEALEGANNLSPPKIINHLMGK
jgi:hypothetical protein